MHLSLLAVFLSWVPIGIFLFSRYPPRIAILVNFFGGWALLPGARYLPTTADFPYWILGVCLPTNYFLTKATITGLTGLAGFLLFRFTDLKSFRPGLCDLPMALWCCVPLLSAITHWSTLREGLTGAVYLTLAWGTPWLLGRIYFSDHNSLLLAAKACVIAGICYIPICLVEIFTGPRLYAFLYGYEPYRWVGAGRYFGFRPIGLLEDGNQLGVWMAAATLIAVALAVRGLAKRILGLPTGWVAAGLAVTTLLCQSAGSILLLLLLLPLALLKRRSVLRAAILVLIFGIVAFAILRMAGHTSLRALAEDNHLLHSVADGFARVGRHSLLWRLARDESHMAVALQTPLLGSGRWDWWQTGNARPWDLWLLIFGMYGSVGMVAFGLILFLPVVRVVWSFTDAEDADRSNLRLALAALILMVAFDNLLNGAMILPYILVMGGLASPEKAFGDDGNHSLSDPPLVPVEQQSGDEDVFAPASA